MIGHSLLAAAVLPLCFVHGQWFDGTKFVPKSFCAEGRVLVQRQPRTGDRTIDLGGKFVVPPFGEAHNHNVEGGERLQGRISAYLGAGVYYVKNPNNLPRTVPRDRVNQPRSIDAVFAQASLTGPGGHPLDVMKRLIDRGIAKPEDADGGFYFIIRDARQLAERWPAVLANRPDFIKTYLLYSEDYERRKDDPAKAGWNGLDPALLPEIVARARAAGLPVTTHVETAADFRAAVAAGVDEINHLPGFRPEGEDFSLFTSGRARLTDADARAAARKGIVVVTTVGESINMAREQKQTAWLETIEHNLRTLHRNGVRLAIGSDDYGRGVVPEALALATLGIFSNAELLRMWTEHTAAAIFPGRKIGKLRPGYEASFLVLGANPLHSFAAVQTIELRVKEGEILSAR